MKSFVARVVALSLLLSFLLLSGFAWLKSRPVYADRAELAAVAGRYPKFSMQQRMAVLRARQAQLHPQWKDLSVAQIAERLIKWATAQAAPAQANANFSGNTTTISVPGTDFLGISRQTDCSLTLRDAPYTLDNSSLQLSYTIANSIPNYDQVLHQEAGLTTTPGKFPAGCGDPVLGISARKIVYLGMTTQALKVYAGTFYNGLLGEQQIFSLIAKADDTWVSSEIVSTTNSTNLATSELNGDGNGDLVSVTEDTTSNTGTIQVFLGNADGSFQAPVSYTLPGSITTAAVIDDVNGDGKLDIVASSQSQTTSAYEVSFLGGKGDGTFFAPQSFSVTAPSGIRFEAYDGLITADLRGNGKKDLITRTGIVLLGNGDGTFTQSATPAFTATDATSDMGPNLVAADFNKDGKIDLAVGNGEAVNLYTGNGDGTFTPSYNYAAIGDIGYVNALDLDGDGNLDIYVGLANGGMVGGDSFTFGEGYALMGRGDGTFAGAPQAPFVSVGTNVADLNGDKIIDGVGVNSTLNSSTVSFTSYLGHANGTFTPTATLQVSPTTISGNPVTFEGIDSYGLGDISGDGIADLVYIPEGNFGYFVATGKGDGSFTAPVFNQIPSFIPPPDGDYSPAISGLFLADFNHDGKADVIYNFTDQGYQSHTNVFGVAVQISNGDGTFQAPKILQSYSSTSSGQPPPDATLTVDQLGDVNGDGFPDLFVLRSSAAPNTQGNYYDQLFLYLGNGDGTFQSTPTMPVPSISPYSAFGPGLGPLVLADMNGDGHVDIVSLGSNGTNSVVAISFGKGDGTFAAPVTTLNAGSVNLAVGDFNGDGKPDVFVNGFTPPSDTGVYLGNGDGTLQSVSSGELTVPSLGVGLYVEGPAVVTDFNGDGTPDVFSGGASLLNQTGASSVTGATTTTTLTASATTVNVGASVTFTAKVTSMNTGIPIGTVTFLSGQTLLGAGTLDQTGTATFTTTALPAGTDSITAAYGGDPSFAASTSSAVTVTVAPAAAGSFTLTLSPASGSVAPGASATTTVSVNPSGGFNQQVSLACTGAPMYSTCSVAPGAVTPNGSAATATVTIATAVASASVSGEHAGSIALAMLGGGAALGLVWLRRRRLWARYGLAVLLAVSLCGLMQACGGGSKKSSGGTTSQTPAGTYTLTLTGTGTGGAPSQTAIYSLTVQ